MNKAHDSKKGQMCTPAAKQTCYLLIFTYFQSIQKSTKIKIECSGIKKKKNVILEVCGQRGVALLGRLRLPQVAKLKSFILFF